jgi:hypothetical protein
MSQRPLRSYPTPIRITAEVLRLYHETIPLHPPETFAILGGRLEDPFLVTDFRFCPPRRNGNGDLDASSVHINVDHDLMNFIVDEEWKPAGKYMLGVWHSHPPGVTAPSHGDPTTNTGDIAFFTSCLQHDDSSDRAWRFFLAPITTFDADGADRIHGWVLKRGSQHARPCPVVLDPTPAFVLAPHVTSCVLSEFPFDEIPER